MTQTIDTVEAISIIPTPDLDPIRVYWDNVGPGQGHVTMICYGQAWTSYFGGMGDGTIQQFFSEVGVDYLVNKMGISGRKQATEKRDAAYLGRIIEAVKVALREQISREAIAESEARSDARNQDPDGPYDQKSEVE